MKKIHVVMGSNGEYSDRTDWPVISYFDKEKAEKHVINAEKRVAEIIVQGSALPSAERKNEYDKGHVVCYDDNYFLYEVDLVE